MRYVCILLLQMILYISLTVIITAYPQNIMGNPFVFG